MVRYISANIYKNRETSAVRLSFFIPEMKKGLSATSDSPFSCIYNVLIIFLQVPFGTQCNHFKIEMLLITATIVTNAVITIVIVSIINLFKLILISKGAPLLFLLPLKRLEDICF